MVDRKDDEEVVYQQRRNDRSFGKLDAHSHGSAAKALAHSLLSASLTSIVLGALLWHPDVRFRCWIGRGRSATSLARRSESHA